jgi:hypothetical protein
MIFGNRHTENPMRLGLFSFSCLLAGLVTVLLFVAPLSYEPSVPPGGTWALVARTPICLVMDYNYEEDQGDLDRLPRTIELRADLLRRDGSWLQAILRPRPEAFLLAGWRPAGTDSVDIAWYHSSVIRLPVPRPGASDSVVGRLAPRGFAPFMWQLKFPSYRAVARTQPCTDVRLGEFR